MQSNATIGMPQSRTASRGVYSLRFQKVPATPVRPVCAIDIEETERRIDTRSIAPASITASCFSSNFIWDGVCRIVFRVSAKVVDRTEASEAPPKVFLDAQRILLFRCSHDFSFLLLLFPAALMLLLFSPPTRLLWACSHTIPEPERTRRQNVRAPAADSRRWFD